MKRKLLEIAHHRNGICGEGFYVATFTEDGRHMVAVTFYHDRPACRTAVFATSALTVNNVAFGGGNSWRGDHYHEWMLRQIDAYEARRLDDDAAGA